MHRDKSLRSRQTLKSFEYVRIYELKLLAQDLSEEQGFLRSAGWIVCDANSPRWWDNLRSYEEIVICSILVQISSWKSAKKALINLRKAGLANLRMLSGARIEEIEKLINPVGFRSVKARRLINVAREIERIGGLNELKELEDPRRFLLSIDGIGKETADAIMLFALNIPTVPVSNYVRLVLNRIGFIKSKCGYEELRREILRELNANVYSLKLFYAGITSVGRIACKKERPKCDICPLKCVCMGMDLFDVSRNL